VLFSLLFAGCMAKDFIKPTQDQIDQYVQQHPDLPELDKACIYDGRFEVGMQAASVAFLLGEPRLVETVQQPWAKQQKWTYKRGNFKVFYMEDNGVVAIEER
jgi:outer membrane protein assembly factor BamE (lipoprotein component of BamABCDE complex)